MDVLQFIYVGITRVGRCFTMAVFPGGVLCWCCKGSVPPGYFPCQAEEVSSARSIKGISDLLMKHRTVCFSQLCNPLCCINLFLLLFYKYEHVPRFPQTQGRHLQMVTSSGGKAALNICPHVALQVMTVLVNWAFTHWGFVSDLTHSVTNRVIWLVPDLGLYQSNWAQHLAIGFLLYKSCKMVLVKLG